MPADALDIDQALHRIAFEARVTERGLTRVHRVVFEGVREFTREDSSSYESGDLLELSVIELEREDGGWRVWLNPWYVQQIEFRCDRIQLDHVEVIGSGRWLQDDLPSRPAGYEG
jgi:hypothetical protein